MYLKPFLYLFLLITIISCGYKNSSRFNIREAEGFPRWLKDNHYSGDQTSGIAFIGRDVNDLKTFLIAEDIGKIYHLKMKNDTIFSLTPVLFGSEAEKFVDTFPKADFEDITFDRFSGNVFLSLEGNFPDPKKFTCICKINFERENPFSNKIISFKKLNIQPEDSFLKYAGSNTGYEGIAADSIYLYLGLEGLKPGPLFADSTVIMAVSKDDLKIKKIIGTKALEIQTICGLYSINEKDLIGIDRNNRRLFRIIFNNDLTVKRIMFKDIEPRIPSFPAFTYVASLESVSMDDQRNLYLVDDPWKQFFIPSNEVLQKIDSTALKNFKGFVPIIYKFKLAE